MEWVDCLQEATGWREPRWKCDWALAESALGTTLSADYKELCERFGPGYFSSYMWVVPDRGQESVVYWWQFYQEIFAQNPAGAAMSFSPYQPYGMTGRQGLLLWGTSETGGDFFWLANAAEDPDTWPIMAKREMIGAEKWYRFDMLTSEFVYRAIADPEFKPFTVARPDWPPSFERFVPSGSEG